MEKDKSLREYLTQYAQSGRIAMHMPGHKRTKVVSAHLAFDAMQDFTEIEATDNLHDASGVLKDSMELASRLWKSEASFYLVNGSTCGILAGIRALTKRGDKILVSRNAHKSVFHAIELCGLVPIFILPPQVPFFGVCGSIEPMQVAQAFSEHPDIRLAVITSPTYEGVLSDISAISRIVHENDALLFVDEAHGAHLGLHPTFEASALACGADLVVQSLHKTLAALTQTAILHVGSARVDIARLKQQLAVFETSSPSYPLMASADGCVRSILESAEVFESWLIALAGFSIWAGQFVHLKALGIGDVPPQVYAFDQTKLYISTAGTNISGTELAKRLAAYRIDVEMVSRDGVLAMTGMGDSIESVGVLAEALIEIDATLLPKQAEETAEYVVPEAVLAPEQAQEAPFEMRQLRKSMGCVSAEYVWAYPPGIPLLIPGERIGEQFVQQAEQLLNSGIVLKKSRSEQNNEIAVIAS